MFTFTTDWHIVSILCTGHSSHHYKVVCYLYWVIVHVYVPQNSCLSPSCLKLHLNCYMGYGSAASPMYRLEELF